MALVLFMVYGNSSSATLSSFPKCYHGIIEVNMIVLDDCNMTQADFDYVKTSH